MLQTRNGKSQLRGEVLGDAALPALVPAWQSLCARAAEDNVYYSPRYARALISNLKRDPSLRFAVVWRGQRLVALLPFTLPKIALPFLGGVARAWQTDYTFSCVPLLDRDQANEAAAGLVELLGTINEGEWVIPTLSTSGIASLAIVDALKKDGHPWQLSNAFQRATLESSNSLGTDLQTHCSAKRRRELARNRRRLEEIGKVVHESHHSGDGLTRAVEVFLEIELKGWKGRRGTALACNPLTKQFALDAFTGDSNSICRADVLTLNGTPIAVGLTVFAGGTGFTVKCTYDEAYRSYSVGLLLETEVIRSFVAERWASRLDAATAGEHVIDSLWPGRTEVADLIFTLAQRHSRLRLSTLVHTVRSKHAAKSAVKAWAARVTAG